MKTYSKRFLAVFLSLFLIIAPTIQQANAASSWSITSAVSAGSRTVVTATKSGYKSAINVAPTAGRLALKVGRGLNAAAVAYAILSLIPAGVDYVMDNENNKVKYTDKPRKMYSYNNGKVYLKSDSFESICSMLAAYVGASAHPTIPSDINNRTCSFLKDGQFIRMSVNYGDVQPDPQYIPYSQVASQVIKNANSGHSDSQDATRNSAIEMVVGGQFDQDFLAGAVPTSDNKPLIPSVPISGNGNQSYGGVGVGDSADDGMSGATPGDQADAAKDAADAAKKAAQAAADAAQAASDAAREAADNAADVVNSGADAAAQAAAEQAAAAAEQAAADAKAVSDAAVAAANERAAAAERAAEAATQAAQAAAEKAAADVAAAKAAGDAAAVAAAEAAKAAADAAVAAAKEKQAAAEKAAEKAKAEATKPFELPAFCTWASIVCETAKWLKEEPAALTPTAIDTTSPIDDFDSDKSYITFTGSCPPKYTASLNIMGATAPFEFDYTPICTVMSYLKPFIVGAGYIAAAYIIAGHSRGSKD